ncbi:DUF2130 domain-containing protein [Filimonas effusa]|uniref:DUF2130 domain-containing protein n=1 Tax=Filimonas effusa TaxID=2508721 RepID=A0A4Q1DB74_9BACT|nr:DUF2130 domain-containing protein [Filimonas effusa]RXK86540.1 DUF2130 domain-containing protein [Filimonas effusa]
MAYVVTCPSCGNSFDPGDSIRDQVQKDLRNQMVDWQKKKDDEFKKKETEFQKLLEQQQTAAAQQLQTEKIKLQQELQENIRRTVAADYENQLKILQQSAADSAEKLKEARNKELAFLQKEQELKNKEAELEIQLQKRLLEERNSLSEQIRKEESERAALKDTETQLRMRELEKQLEDQKKLAEEMRRKAEQGSMQLQGEAQELLLEEILRATFPFDEIKEVGKGVRGADCIQMVRNQFGIEAGKIIYESKRTKDFSIDWIDKLKADMRSLGADVAVIVTQALPKEMDRFGEKEGVYICTFAEAKSVALVLRNAILKIADARRSQENKGDKMVLLYDYLTGNEFSAQWQAIREGFMSMRLSIQRERDAMEKLWKAREKQLEKVMLNAAHIRGSIEGIAGSDAVNLNLLDDADTSLLD